MNKFLISSALLLTPLAAFSAVLFDHSSFNGGALPSDGITTNGSQFWNTALADNFTLSSDSTPTSISVWGGSTNFFFEDLTNMPVFDIQIMNSSFGSVFQTTATLGSLNAVDTGQNNDGDGNIYRLTFNLNQSLAAGSYWLHFGSVNTDAEGDTFMWAEWNSFDDTLALNHFDPDGWIVSESLNGRSFLVEGAPVPEPATMTALALGGLALLRRRKKA